MNCGGSCCAIDEMFDRRFAEAQLERYRRKGPSPSTRKLIDALRKAGLEGATVLDVGGGIGAIALELVGDGAERATVVDASAASLAAGRSEAARRNTSDRVDLMHGDFVALAPELPPADIVTLDKVVCCYPDMEPLIGESATRARRLYGIIYPRDAGWLRLGVAVLNAMRRVRGKAFRAHVYANAAIEAVIRRAGLTLRTRQRGLVWVVDLYDRASRAGS